MENLMNYKKEMMELAKLKGFITGYTSTFYPLKCLKSCDGECDFCESCPAISFCEKLKFENKSIMMNYY